MTRDEAEQSTILRCLVGSTAHGIGGDDGTEDRDEMGVLLEPIERAIGFSDFEQFIYRSAAEREGKHDARSMAGDLDLTLYSLRKFCRLALQGNPSVIMLLFADPLVADARGLMLREMVPAFASREAGKRFLGYLIAQKQRLLGERGGKDVNRPELVEKYGYDTKFAAHALRLGYQGLEYLETGRMTLPMVEPLRSRVRSVRTGGVSFQDALTEIGDVERQLKDAIDVSPLPPHPDRSIVEAWMVQTYFEHWKTSGSQWERSLSFLRGGVQ